MYRDDTKGRFYAGFGHEAANPQTLNNFHCLIYGGVMNSRTVVGNVIINTRGRISVELSEPRLVSLETMPMGEERKLGKGALVKLRAI